MVGLLASAASLVFLASAVSAQSDIPSCGPGNLCPENLPCCSQYGQCGLGAYCLGGCDPLFSNSLESCVPAPVCQSKDYKLNSLDGIMPNTKYLGDATKSNWVSSGKPVQYEDSILLTMEEGSVGTLLASTAYVWYGKISASLKSSRGTGVVTAFILLSDVKDEIDFEFVGTDLDTAQSNYYFQGITNYNNGANISVQDTFDTYHTYEIDWTPESITWSVDGTAYRTQNKNETWNATSNQYHFPQTPARVQLSLWPAGLASNAKGTVDWAGGLVNWNSPDIKNAGYYYSMVKEVNVQCYQPPPGADVSGSTSYVYTALAGTNDTVSTTDDSTVLKSLLGSGTNMSADYPKAATSSGAPTPTNEVATIPGLTGAGPGTDGHRGNSDDSGPSNTDTVSDSDPDGSIPSTVPSATVPQSTGIGGFTQGNQGPASGAPPKGERVLQGSLFAILVAVVGMLAM